MLKSFLQKGFFISALLLFCAAGPPPKKEIKDVKESKVEEGFSRWQISGELLGPGFLYQFYASFRPVRHLSLNLGASYYSFTFRTTKTEIAAIPISASYLIFGPKHFLELNGGGTLGFVSQSTTDPDAGTIKQSFIDKRFLPVFGIGYRMWRETGGFHFRAMADVILGNSVIPWAGVSFGYAFRP